MLAIIRSIGPRDEIETMLAAQMAAIHMATMTRGRLAQVSNIPQQDSAERALNKLARTFAVQVEALSQTVENQIREIEAAGFHVEKRRLVTASLCWMASTAEGVANGRSGKRRSFIQRARRRRLLNHPQCREKGPHLVMSELSGR